MTAAKHPSRRLGLTMIELLIVLIIMIAISGVILQATAGRIDEAAYDKTVASLNAIRTAIVGNPLMTGDEPIVSYVADCGSLPQKTGTDPAYYLKALTELPSGMTSYQIRTASWPDNDIVTYTGWRGPYIALPLNTDKVLDGWNNPFNFVLSGNTITSIQSGGGLESPYNITIPSTPMQFNEDSLIVTVNGTVTYNLTTYNSSDELTIRIYFPKATDGTLDHREIVLTMDAASGSVPFAFPDEIPIGRHPIRVRVDGLNDNNEGAETGNGNDTFVLEWVTVPQGGLSGVSIIIGN